MRKFFVFLCAGLLVLGLSGCQQMKMAAGNLVEEAAGVAESAVSEAASAASEAVNSVVEEVGDLTELISAVQSLSTMSSEIREQMEGFDQMSDAEKYQALQKLAAEYADVDKLLDEILKLCEGKEVLSGLEFQIKLLKNIEPDMNSLNAEKLQELYSMYPLYVAQVNSSLAMLNKDLDKLKSGGGFPDGVQYFTQAPELPRPDSVIDGFTFVSNEENQDAATFKYDLGTDKEAAETVYQLYLMAAQVDTGLEVSMVDEAGHILKNGKLVGIVAMESKSGGNICSVYLKK